MTLHNIVNVFHATCTPKMANIVNFQLCVRLV